MITSDFLNGPNHSYNSTEGGIIYDRFSYQLKLQQTGDVQIQNVSKNALMVPDL